MYSERFRQFIEIWQRDFAIERSMNEKVCIDRDGKPLPWYTYPAIEYLSQFDYHDNQTETDIRLPDKYTTAMVYHRGRYKLSRSYCAR